MIVFSISNKKKESILYNNILFVCEGEGGGVGMDNNFGKKDIKIQMKIVFRRKML